PFYDRFFGLSGWRDGLIKRGQPLVERWTTRLEYPEKQRRESDSVNWLSEVNQYARQHLKGQELDQFMNNYSTGMTQAKKYDFNMALQNAGTQPGTQEHDIAFEIASKVKLLERCRSDHAHKPVSVPTHEIRFDYLPKNMLESGWERAYPRDAVV